MRLSASDIARFTGGMLVVPPAHEESLVAGFTWDSRQVQPGCLYVALPGERHDGFDFCINALDAGAACLLVMRSPDEALTLCAQRSGAAIVCVEDTFTAFTDLAAAWRSRLSGSVIAITGSSGKTTTKNLVRDVLARAGSVVATQGNQNNELGVPATLLRAEEDTQFVVVEMGMRGRGQIESLCRFVRPDMALVTNVGESHIELLGSRDGIARAKAEIIAGVKANTGIAFINASDDFASMLPAYGSADERGVEILFFDGSGKEPASYAAQDGIEVPSTFASDIELDEAGCARFTLHTPTGTASVHLALAGLHNVHNATAAAAVGSQVGLSASVIVDALEKATSLDGRGRVVRTASGVVVVDDAYNANPDSMKASLGSFAAMHFAGRHIAVLGDMGELGDTAEEAHARIGSLVASLPIDLIICVGSLACGIARAAVAAGMPEDAAICVTDASAALDQVVSLVNAGDGILVKASHSVGLEAVVKGLVK
ncbi:UDP-N-acetylmuramoyl-tripeptide--D-alanyl-D-alanine ligase [Cryptobacterium curtum DSM 15641]|uniref:UDP-N-acetylmuramoyl-tripeptide--D-alanyl-D-alanine ligase n=1 Tax=Cryptobacterium curtum (strain ATCC 700683 / DSM 15641 / CCUG 43107 / 12-3) TaxID=469378 RepID=C7MP09_CRYCD|nr:UDP-N-acetylmuramoyl-tripeptide--D-alanyl-D-alanine ligase [Cryptobacterium curtum]ACU94649.1 UDP-N-acetylmuramoyl-tripeptide--D-alanyl-D-alanine ligase [Cryptobacterium curtum DSM 15641]